VVSRVKKNLGKNEISKPVYFERKEHAGWDPVTQTFILNEVPTEIKQILKKAGFKKKDLKQKDTALAIFEVLLQEVDLENMGPAHSNNTNSSAVFDQQRLPTQTEKGGVRGYKNHQTFEGDLNSSAGNVMQFGFTGRETEFERQQALMRKVG